MTFVVDVKEIEEFERDLKTFARRAFPFATKATLNTAAFTGQKIARNDVKASMVLRNRFTIQSIQVEQSRTLMVNRQSSSIGSTVDYMATQEFGGVVSASGSQGVAIATGYASGQENAEPRTRLPRKPNKLRNIQLNRRRGKTGKNKKQALLFKTVNAVKTGQRYFYHDFERSKGIFKVIGGSRTVKRGWPKGAKIKMVWDMSQKSVTIPRNPWLKPSIDKTRAFMPGIYRDALQFQLNRQGIFR